MRSVTVAFYSCVLGLLGMGLRELMWGSEENRCSMTYMFEYPEYRRVQLPRRVANQYPGYGLYLYGEGAYAQETRGLKLSGAPVLFLPGNAGSYKQARSLGSVALRKAERMAGKIHLNVFTVDFREELVALYGGSLQRQTLFLHESIKAILRLYKNQPHPPRSVVLVGHSMGGVVARALFTLPRFDPTLVSLILTQASPHQAPVLALDADLLDFYSAVRRHWCAGREELRNVTVLSVGGGHRDYQVRSGLTALPCPQGDPSKLSMVTTAVPRTWVSTDHLSIVWCKELVLATVRAFFDLIDPDTRQFTEDQQRRMAVLKHHFIRHSMRLLEEQHDTAVSLLSGPAEAWTEVNTLRLLYSAPKEPRVKYFLFALSGRRKAYSHFHCRSSSLEMSSWLYGCTQMNTSLCVQAIDLSWGTELLPAYKVVTVRLSDLSSVSHLVISASNLAGNQFSVECEWLNLDSRMVSTPVPHVLSLGLTVSDITLNSTGLLHTVRLENFHQVYQAFRITVMSQCKTAKDRLPSVYRLSVPWFREGFFTAASVPSVTEIAAMLHTSRPDNTSSVLLQLHAAPNCQYKVSVRTSFPKVLGQMLRYCGPTLPSYTAVGLLLACERQIDSLIRTGRPLAMSTAVGAAIQPHKVEIPVYLLQLLLRLSWFRDGWSALSLPLPDGLPVSTLDGAGSLDPAEDWSRLLGLVLQVLGAAVAFWGSALFQLALRALSLLMAPLHRPCLSRHCGVLHPWAQVLLILTLGLLGRVTCGALAFFLAFLCYLYRVLRLLMTQRTLKHVLNLAPQQQKVEKRSSPVDEDGHLDEDGHAGTAKSNGGPLLTDLVLQEVTDDLELHLSLSALLTLPLVLITPSMIHWAWSLRYAIRLHPDPCWPLTLPLLTSTILLINCSCVSFKRSKLLVLVPLLLPPLCVAMATFTLLHLYRVTPLLCMALILLLLCSHV